MLKLTGQLAEPLWRVQNLYLIRDKDKNRVRPKFKPSQIRIAEAVRGRLEAGLSIRHYDLKCRQSMVTTFWMLFYLDDSIFNRNTRSAILAQKNDTLNMIWEAVRFAHGSMPERLQPSLEQDSAKVLSFKGMGSWIKVALRVQGGTLNNLHISEFPLCDPNDIRQTIAACPVNANITLEGVAEGSNHAYDKWREEGDDYTRLFHPWFLQPEYRLPVAAPLVRSKAEERLADMALKEYGITIHDEQIAYRRRAFKDLQNLALQEMAEDPETCFLSTGGAFFDGKKFRVLRSEALAENRRNVPLNQDGDEKSETGRLIVIERPIHKCVYAAGADIAEGTETGADKDYSVLCILCTTHRRLAYRYRARIGTDTFYRHCDKICREYNTALIAPEINGTYGGVVLNGLREVCKYPKVFFQEKNTRVITPKTPLKRTYGWETTQDSKPLMLSQLKRALEGKSEEDENSFAPEFSVLDPDFLEEALYIVQDGVKIQAGAGRHDDLVMAYAIAYQVYRRIKSSEFSPKDFWFGGSLESASS